LGFFVVVLLRKLVKGENHLKTKHRQTVELKWQRACVNPWLDPQYCKKQ
jgi:hypothetical protein